MRKQPERRRADPNLTDFLHYVPGQGQRDRACRRNYPDRELARRDIYDYIEMFYSPERRYGYNNKLSPIEYEKQFSRRLLSV